MTLRFLTGTLGRQLILHEIIFLGLTGQAREGGAACVQARGTHATLPCERGSCVPGDAEEEGCLRVRAVLPVLGSGVPQLHGLKTF